MRAFFQDLRIRGLGDPLLVVSDGASGIIRAIEECFPRSARQRCLAHRMRNLAAKVSADPMAGIQGPGATACYQAPSRAAIARANWRPASAPITPTSCRARSLASKMISSPASRTCGCAVTHRRFVRFSENLLERLFVEERRRLKIIPNGFGEEAGIKLMFRALIRAAERWR